jgi:hypothetical protein
VRKEQPESQAKTGDRLCHGVGNIAERWGEPKRNERSVEKQRHATRDDRSLAHGAGTGSQLERALTYLSNPTFQDR